MWCQATSPHVGKVGNRRVGKVCQRFGKARTVSSQLAGPIAHPLRFEPQVDPDRRLPDGERRRRAEAAKKAYFTGLALKSSKARRAQRERKG